MNGQNVTDKTTAVSNVDTPGRTQTPPSAQQQATPISGTVERPSSRLGLERLDCIVYDLFFPVAKAQTTAYRGPRS